MLERWLLLWLTLSSLAAFFWSGWGVWDPFAASAPHLNWLIAVTMFAIGWMLPAEEMRQVVRRWPTVLGGTALQYISMPLLAYAMGHFFGLSGPAKVGLIMAGCVPGAMASNVLTLVARGNVSYSVSLTTSATLLSPLFVPLSLALLLDADVEFLPLEASLQLCGIVVGPVLLGHFVGRSFPQYERIAGRLGSTIANLTILWVIAVVVGVNRDRLEQLDRWILLAVLSVNLLGYLAGYAGGKLMRLPEPMRRALTMEIGMQNAGLGTVLVLQLFPTMPEAAIPTALYTFACMFTGTMLARIWAGRTEKIAAELPDA